MLAVYALAIASMKSADCVRVFGESKSVLESRYRTGALQALSGTDVLLTRELEVLQALALVLVRPTYVASPEVESCSLTNVLSLAGISR